LDFEADLVVSTHSGGILKWLIFFEDPFYKKQVLAMLWLYDGVLQSSSEFCVLCSRGLLDIMNPSKADF
jgi:hypothetical protein